MKLLIKFEGSCWFTDTADTAPPPMSRHAKKNDDDDATDFFVHDDGLMMRSDRDFWNEINRGSFWRGL
jgi:hypothetical protein